MSWPIIFYCYHCFRGQLELAVCTETDATWDIGILGLSHGACLVIKPVCWSGGSSSKEAHLLF